MSEKLWKNEHVYNAFDDLTRLSESVIEKKGFHYATFSETVIRERIIQRVVQLTFYPYCKECTHRAKAGEYPFPSKDEILNLDGVLVNCENGSLRLTTKRLLKLVVDYLAEWLIIIYNILVGFLTADSKNNQPATWVFGLGFADVTAGGTEETFKTFCKEGPIQPLAEAETLIIQEFIARKSGIDLLVYTKKPLHYQLRECRIGFFTRWGLLFNCLLNPFLFLAAVIRMPLSALLSKDFIQYPAVHILDKHGLIKSVIITNSNFFQQSLWMRGPDNRGFRVHELHYGQNAVPFRYKDNPVTGFFPPFRHVRVDEHWVWTDGYKDFLIETGHKGPVHVVGPIVWYLPQGKIERADDRITIAVFDVAPVYQSVADKMGIIHYYYTADKLIEFLETIINICEELTKEFNRQIKIILKSKRHFTKGLHDQLYIDYINTLQEKHAQIEIADTRINIFSLLSTCDFSVSIPYTTVPYVAAYLQKPAAYYDPRSELIFTNEPSSNIYTASGKSELKELIKTVIMAINTKHKEIL